MAWQTLSIPWGRLACAVAGLSGAAPCDQPPCSSPGTTSTFWGDAGPAGAGLPGLWASEPDRLHPDRGRPGPPTTGRTASRDLQTKRSQARRPNQEISHEKRDKTTHRTSPPDVITKPTNGASVVASADDRKYAVGFALGFVGVAGYIAPVVIANSVVIAVAVLIFLAYVV